MNVSSDFGLEYVSLTPGRKQHSQGNKKAEDDANAEAEKKIKEIKDSGKKSQDKVINDLLSAVFDVKPVAPTQA